MIRSSQKSDDFFVYIQVETGEILSQLFRFDERAYDVVMVNTKRVLGDFKNITAVIPVVNAYIAEAAAMPHCRIIIGMHSGLFTSAETVVTLRRQDPKRVVDDAELENLLSSGLWKIFSRDQKELARKMNCSESATVLINAFISQIRVDGYRVASPVGFPAHTIELTVLYGASTKAAYEMLAPVISSESEVYCTEIGVSELLRLVKQKENSTILLVRVSESYTYVYASGDGEQRYIDSISWGRRSLIHTLVEELMVSEVQAAELLRLADVGLTSAHTRRRIEALLLQEIAVLLKGIGAHADKQRYEAVYVAAPFSLPDALFSEGASRRAGIMVPVVPMPDNSHGGKAGIALPLSMRPLGSSASALCANAWAASRFFEPSDVQKIAKRRARWLANSTH